MSIYRGLPYVNLPTHPGLCVSRYQEVSVCLYVVEGCVYVCGSVYTYPGVALGRELPESCCVCLLCGMSASCTYIHIIYDIRVCVCLRMYPGVAMGQAGLSHLACVCCVCGSLDIMYVWYGVMWCCTCIIQV